MEKNVSNKLLPKTVGLFRVLSATPDTVTIDEDGIPYKVSIDRITPVIGAEIFTEALGSRETVVQKGEDKEETENDHVLGEYWQPTADDEPSQTD